MATIKWKNLNEQWETFYHGAFQNIKANLKNIILSINNTAAAIRMRCRRDKNLSDIYDAAEGRINLELINDCSALPRAPHHHDSRYIPKIEAERNRAMAEELRIWNIVKDFNSCNCTPAPPPGDNPGPTGPGPTGPTPTPTPTNPIPTEPIPTQPVNATINGTDGLRYAFGEGTSSGTNSISAAWPKIENINFPGTFTFESTWEGQGIFNCMKHRTSDRWNKPPANYNAHSDNRPEEGELAFEINGKGFQESDPRESSRIVNIKIGTNTVKVLGIPKSGGYYVSAVWGYDSMDWTITKV